MTDLRVAKEVYLPIDAVTQKLAWLGRTGSGKTYGCKGMVEQMLDAGAQVIVLDSMGVWAGLRLGPKPFNVPVLGGLFGDIPLESTSGALIADLAVDHGSSMVLDLSQMLDADRTRFARAFAARFFQRKKSEPGAVHLVLDECQDFVPQNPQDGEKLMLHEFHRIAKQGRVLGIGVSFVSQRPQEVNKKALNQVECVFAFQMTGPHERKALEYWLSDKGFDGKLSDILPRLEVGRPHVWSPQWLKLSRVVTILPIRSLDTSKTPEVGDKACQPKKLGPIDLKALTAAMADTIERAKADDPTELRARVAELERQLAEREPDRVEVPMFDQEAFDELQRELTDGLSLALGNAKGALHTYMSKCLRAAKARPGSLIGEERRSGDYPTGTLIEPLAKALARRRRDTQPSVAPRRVSEAPRAAVTSGLTKGQDSVLVVVAQHPEGVDRTQIAIISGYRRSTRDRLLQELQAKHCVSHDGTLFRVTDIGRASLPPDWKPLPTGKALREYWLARLPPGNSAVLEVAVRAYPRAVSREAISAATEYKRSTRDRLIQELKARRLLVDASGGAVKASEGLF